MTLKIPQNIINISYQGVQQASKVIAGASKNITSPTSSKTSSIFTTIKSFIASKSTGAKLAKVGLGATVLAGGIAVAGTSLGNTGSDVAKKFNIPTELLFIVGAIILIMILMGGKRK